MQLTKHSTKTLNNGLKMPVIGLGVWQAESGQEVEQAILWALEAGYRHIDTARIYDNEESIGKAIKASGIPREEIFITTKLWNDDQGNPHKAFEDSLKRLQLEYIDLYLIHFPVGETRKEAWKQLEQIATSGRTKAIGVSNYTVRHLQELMEFSITVPTVNQVEFHPFLFQKELMDFCNQNNIALEAYSPLGQGKLVGDERISTIANKYNKSNAQIMIKWSLQHGNIVIPKSVHKERIYENIDVFDFDISDEDMRYLDSLNENVRTCWDPTDM